MKDTRYILIEIVHSFLQMLPVNSGVMNLQYIFVYFSSYTWLGHELDLNRLTKHGLPYIFITVHSASKELNTRYI